MAQTSPEDLGEKGLENKQEAEPEKSPKGVQGQAGEDALTGARGKEHILGVRGDRSAQTLMWKCEDTELHNFWKTGKIRVLGRMRESQKISYLGR